MLYFETKDLGLAAMLLTVGHKLYEIDKTDPRKAIFIFLESGYLTRDVKSYWTSDFRNFIDNMKMLKTRLYN